MKNFDSKSNFRIKKRSFRKSHKMPGGGGNETHSHLERCRSPARTTFENFKKSFFNRVAGSGQIILPTD